MTNQRQALRRRASSIINGLSSLQPVISASLMSSSKPRCGLLHFRRQEPLYDWPSLSLNDFSSEPSHTCHRWTFSRAARHDLVTKLGHPSHVFAVPYICRSLGQTACPSWIVQDKPYACRWLMRPSGTYVIGLSGRVGTMEMTATCEFYDDGKSAHAA